MGMNTPATPQPRPAPTMRVEVVIEFPALDNLVALLSTAGQQKIDSLTAQVLQLTEGLNQSTSSLERAEHQEH